MSNSHSFSLQPMFETQFSEVKDFEFDIDELSLKLWSIAEDQQKLAGVGWWDGKKLIVRLRLGFDWIDPKSSSEQESFEKLKIEYAKKLASLDNGGKDAELPPYYSLINDCIVFANKEPPIQVHRKTKIAVEAKETELSSDHYKVVGFSIQKKKKINENQMEQLLLNATGRSSLNRKVFYLDPLAKAFFSLIWDHTTSRDSWYNISRIMPKNDFNLICNQLIQKIKAYDKKSNVILEGKDSTENML